MAKFFDSITDQIKEFIEKQHIFFVSSAPAQWWRTCELISKRAG